MHITLISSDIVWEDKAANFSLLEKLFAGFSSSTDLVVLPEMFATGFTMNKSVAEDLTG
jgi:predicted amidohydrolase